MRSGTGHPTIDELNLVEEFGLGILEQPADRVLAYRTILIAREEKRRNDNRGPSAEAAVEEVARRAKRRTR